VVFLLVVVLLGTARGESAPAFVKQGNELYGRGNFNEAMGKYDEALLESPGASEAKFNKANCYYRLDDLTAAMELYREAAAESKDMKLVARARYNLGNCCFEEGLKQRDSNLDKAMEGLKNSIVHWRQALDIEPENEKAAKNIEVARLIIKDIIDQLNKQKQEQEQKAAKQKELQEKLKELLEKQKGLSQETQQTKDQAARGDISKEQAASDYTKQATEQSQLREQAQQTSQELRQQQDPNNPPPEQMQHAAEALDQASVSQTKAEERLNAADGAEGKRAEDRAVEHIENALKALSQGDQQNQQPERGRPQEPNQPQDANEGGQPKEQEAYAPDATAQEILDKERQEKDMRQMLQRGGYQKVDRDW
jgi:Ca-activated chloride channel family protein